MDSLHCVCDVVMKHWGTNLLSISKSCWCWGASVFILNLNPHFCFCSEVKSIKYIFNIHLSLCHVFNCTTVPLSRRGVTIHRDIAMQNSDDVYRGHVTHTLQLCSFGLYRMQLHGLNSRGRNLHIVNWSRDPAGCFVYNIKLLFAVFF